MLNKKTVSKCAFLLLLISIISFPLSLSAALDSDLLAGMKARAIGPAAIGGRIAAIDVVQSNTNHMVVGAGTGGVWNAA